MSSGNNNNLIQRALSYSDPPNPTTTTTTRDPPRQQQNPPRVTIQSALSYSTPPQQPPQRPPPQQWLLSLNLPSPTKHKFPSLHSLISSSLFFTICKVLFLLPFSGSLLNHHKLMAQYLLPDNWVSHTIAASTVVAMADGGSRMPDDAASEVATVALTSSMVLKGTRGCNLTVGISLCGATLTWPPKAPPWASATARTKLHVANPLTRHYEEEERQVLYLSDPFLFFLLSLFSPQSKNLSCFCFLCICTDRVWDMSCVVFADRWWPILLCYWY